LNCQTAPAPEIKSKEAKPPFKNFDVFVCWNFADRQLFEALDAQGRDDPLENEASIAPVEAIAKQHGAWGMIATILQTRAACESSRCQGCQVELPT